MRVSPSLADSDNGQAPPRSSAASPDLRRARRISATQPPAPYAQTQIAPTPSASVLVSLCVGAAPRDCTTTSHPFQTCCCIGTDADDDNLASRAVAHRSLRRAAAAHLRKHLAEAAKAARQAATLGDAARNEARPSGGRAQALCQKHERHLWAGTTLLVMKGYVELWERRRAPCGGDQGSRILPGPCRVRRR